MKNTYLLVSPFLIATAGANALGDISIDDVIFTSGPCVESAAIGASCTFTDFAQCGFTQNSTESTLVWITSPAGLQQTRTPLIPYDHTTGTSTGAYVFIDLENQGEKLNGRLLSPIYPIAINQSYCVEFYYVLVGSNNSFNVFTESASGTRRTVFTRNYDHGYVWNKGEATVSSISPFRIGFEIVTGYLRQGTVHHLGKKSSDSMSFSSSSSRFGQSRWLHDQSWSMRLPRWWMYLRRWIPVLMDKWS